MLNSSKIFLSTNKLLYLDLKLTNILAHIDDVNKFNVYLGDIGSLFPSRDKYYCNNRDLLMISHMSVIKKQRF